MPTRKQHPHPSGQVVSVRLSKDIIERIDALAEHTGRSRGLYIRLALTTLLPLLEADHWTQKTVHYEREVLERDFMRITTHLIEDLPAGDQPE